ncbi:vacuolar protein sorting-associated protein 55 homolog [Asparagus officinalis]|uniref:vacuolar protein sorting-associated protein 55 homolog n=1 Tax=Asparagus officinalis TaxID=4686 RepID=UPI00098E2C3B|nr:vacuolar protein sorting-associated protein 55 homolog [Asparagus officinalis]
MADLPRFVVACLSTGRIALLAIMISVGIILQFLACSLYNNWWPMLTVLTYIILPMPLIFFAGSNSASIMPSDGNSWLNFAKFLTGASIVGSIAIPSILKHADVIGWGALAMEFSSFLSFAVAILCFLGTNNDDEYGRF